MMKTSTTPVCAQLSKECWRRVLLIVVLCGLTLAPVVAQQSDPSLAPQPEPAEAGAGTESMLPHFRARDFGSRGRPILSFKRILSFTRPTADRTVSVLVMKRRPRAF